MKRQFTIATPCLDSPATIALPPLRQARRLRLPKLLCAVLLTLGVVLTVDGAPAAENDLVGSLALAVEPRIASQLDLTDEQRAKLMQLIERRETDGLELILSSKDLPPAEIEARLAPYRKESEQMGLAILTEEQREKLDRARWSRAGAASLKDNELAERLSLSAEQRTTVDQLLVEREQVLAGASGAARARIVGNFDDRLLAILSPEQQTTFRETTGYAQRPVRKEAPANPSTADQSPAPPSTAEPALPVAPRTVQRDEAPVDPTPALATSTLENVSGEQGAVDLRFNFRYQPWGQVLDWFAEQANLSLVMDAPPPGTFNYSDNRAYTPAEAIDLLNSVLLTRGYTLVRRDRMLVVVNLEDGIPPNLVPQITPEELADRGNFELVKVLFLLTKMTPDEAEAEISRLIGPQGQIVKLPMARGILVTETGRNLRLIQSLIDRIESPDASGTLKVFHPASIETAAATIRQLMEIPGDGTTTPDGTMRMAIDTVGGRLFIRGTSDKLARVSEILDALDGGRGGARSGVLESPQLETYSVGSADPQSVLEVLQTLLTGLPDVRLALDPKTNNIIAMARPTQHSTIRATLEQMERDGRQTEVIQLRKIDTTTAMLAINKMFNVTGDKPSASAPRVEAETSARQLLVRGTRAQIDEIKSLLEKMGEAGGDAVAQEQSNVRMLPLTGRDVRTALEQIELVWPTMRENKIRVVTPSAVTSELSGRRPGERPRSKVIADEPFDAGAIEPPAATGNRRSGQTRASELDDPQTNSRRRSLFFLAGQVAELQEEAEDAPADATSQEPAAAPRAEAAPAESAEERAKSEVDGAPILVAPSANGVMIASEDTEALNEFEDLLRALAGQATVGGREFTVFYLNSALATNVSETLTQIFNGGATAGGGGSLMGDIASAALGDMGGGMMGSLLGLGGGAAGAGSSLPGTLIIIPETRLNALIVQGSPAELDMIEQLLEVLDQPDAPETMVALKPRLIPVYNTKASEVAEVVKQVYQDRLIGAGGAQRQPSPEDFLRMLRGSRGGRGGGGGGAASEPEKTKMAIGVDSRTNSLVVSAPQPLYDEVRELVDMLDESQPESAKSIKVVTLQRSNSQAVHKALEAIIGESATTTNAPSSNGPQSSSSSSDRSRDSSRERGGDDNDSESWRRRMDFFRQFRGGSSGSDSGGSRGESRRGR